MADSMNLLPPSVLQFLDSGAAKLSLDGSAGGLLAISCAKSVGILESSDDSTHESLREAFEVGSGPSSLRAGQYLRVPLY